MPIFHVKSVKIYTDPKKFTREFSWRLWQIWGMVIPATAARSKALAVRTVNTSHHFCVTRVSIGCHFGFHWVSFGCHMGVSCFSHGSHLGVNWVSIGCHLGVDWVALKCHFGVNRLSLWVPRAALGCHLGVTWVSPGWLLLVTIAEAYLCPVGSILPFLLCNLSFSPFNFCWEKF